MMKNAGFDPEIMPADIDETLPFCMSPQVATMYLALQKALHVEQMIWDRDTSVPIIIAADTVVVHDGRIIGKPKDKDEAYAILSGLRGTSHHVITGVCIIAPGTLPASTVKHCFYEDTEVFFTDYTDEELLAYIETDEPYDKAGGYAIQGTFARYIDHFEGSLNNVIGFPIEQILPYLAM